MTTLTVIEGGGKESKPKRRRKTPFERLPKTVRRVIEEVRGGEKLCKTLKATEAGTETEFFFEPSGRHVHLRTALKAISSPFLTPSGDGLFGDTQTWMAAR